MMYRLHNLSEYLRRSLKPKKVRPKNFFKKITEVEELLIMQANGHQVNWINAVKIIREQNTAQFMEFLQRIQELKVIREWKQHYAKIAFLIN